MEELYGDTVTQLSPMEENQFNAWAGKMRLEGKIHPQDNFEDYDMRGYWKETGGKGEDTMETHFPDKWKRPNHPTFSTESIYAQGPYKDKYGHLAGSWDGENYLPPVQEEELYNRYINQGQEEYNTLSEKESLEKKFGITIDYYDDDLSKQIDKKAGNLSGKSIEEIADAKDMPTTFVEDLCDISYGFFSGVYEGLRAVQELGAAAGAKVAEWQTGKKIDFDPDKDTRGIGFNKGESPDTVTKLGGLAKGVGQVGVGLMGSSAVGSTKLAALAKTAYGSKAVSLLANAFVGFTVDTMSFSANEANFSDVLKALGLPTIETLAKNPDDTFWQKKLKNGLDGVAAGVVIDGITKAAKMFYNAGKRAIANRKVYEGILEHNVLSSYVAKGPVVDAEFEVLNKELETPMTRILTEEGEKYIPTKDFNRIEFNPETNTKIQLKKEHGILNNAKDLLDKADDFEKNDIMRDLMSRNPDSKDISSIFNYAKELAEAHNYSGNYLSNLFYDISVHPNTQKKVAKEAKSIYNKLFNIKEGAK